jgi:tetratricopeptide (TPR) repeat protein
MKGVESGSITEAETQSAALDALLWRLSHEDVDSANKGIRDQAATLAVASLELQGNIAAGKGDFQNMRRLLQSAVAKEKDLGYSEPPRYSRPALEAFGHVLILAGKFSDASEAFRKELVERPRSGFALFGIALAWDKEGNRDEAAKAYRTFLEAWSHADADLPQIKRAQAYLVRSAR